jgi:hypothetical protein
MRSKGLQGALCVYTLMYTCVPSLPCGACAKPKTAAIVSTRQYTSEYIRIRQHMSAYVRIYPYGACAKPITAKSM